MNLQVLKEAVLAQRQLNEADPDLKAELDAIDADGAVSFEGPNAVADLLDWLDD